MHSGRAVEILLVEDNPADVRFTQEALRDGRLDNHVSVVTTGAEALEYLRKEGRHTGAGTPDLVLLDLNLPGIDGREVLNVMQADSKLADIPVVVLTASKFDQEFLQATGLNAKCYVSKPLEIVKYLDAVRCFEQFSVTIIVRPLSSEASAG